MLVVLLCTQGAYYSDRCLGVGNSLVTRAYGHSPIMRSCVSRPLTVVAGRLAVVNRPGALATLRYHRRYSTESPKSKADSLLAALPGNSVLTKSGYLATGLGAGIYAIANSLYVVNAETCMLACFAGVIYIASKTVAPSYKAWAEGYIQNLTNVLNKARQDHVVAVQNRIEDVNKFSDVVTLTKSLFAVSKETVELEAKAFELKQRAELVNQARAVLDSWVRYESSVRQREQNELVKEVLSKVDRSLASEKVQADILKFAVEEVERVFKHQN